MKIEAIAFRAYSKNTLLGFASFALGQSGLLVHDCCVHCQKGKYWISFPAKSYTDKDGVRQWKPILEFGDAASRARFQQQAIAALRERFPEIFKASQPQVQQPGAHPFLDDPIDDMGRDR
jgi:hypothetical protein